MNITFKKIDDNLKMQDHNLKILNQKKQNQHKNNQSDVLINKNLPIHLKFNLKSKDIIDIQKYSQMSITKEGTSKKCHP